MTIFHINRSSHTPQRRRNTSPIPLGPDLPQAACKGHSKPLWDDFLDDWGRVPERGHERAARHTQAIRICRDCPHLADCLAARTAEPELGWGVFGAQLFTPHGQTHNRGHNRPDGLPHCQGCNKPIPDERRQKGARNCGKNCEGKAYRKRQREQRDTAA